MRTPGSHAFTDPLFGSFISKRRGGLSCSLSVTHSFWSYCSMRSCLDGNARTPSHASCIMNSDTPRCLYFYRHIGAHRISPSFPKTSSLENRGRGFINRKVERQYYCLPITQALWWKQTQSLAQKFTRIQHRCGMSKDRQKSFFLFFFLISLTGHSCLRDLPLRTVGNFHSQIWYQNSVIGNFLRVCLELEYIKWQG